MPEKKLKKFRVTLYYRTCIRKEVEAENEQDAIDKVCSEATEKDVMDNLIEEKDSDVEEIRE